MDEKYYENPTKFDPDRFSEQKKNHIYLPFGDGPRNCIGLRLGKMQTKVGLVMMLQKFKFGLNDDDKNYEMKYDPNIFLLCPKDKIRLSVLKR